jgi:hypothetical protein
MPISTTRSGGILKNAVARMALRDITGKQAFSPGRHAGRLVASSVSRPEEAGDVVLVDGQAPSRASLTASGTFGSSMNP